METTSVSPADKSKTQAETVAKMRAFVSLLVREIVPAPEHFEEAEQVGCLGILVALEKHPDPSTETFPAIAVTEVTRELQLWMARGTAWRRGDDATANARLKAFLASLSDEERQILATENRSPADGSAEAMAYLALLRRACAFIKKPATS